MPPRISIVIPALHEADGINEFVSHLRHIRRAEESEIVIVDGDAEGETIRALEDPHVIAFIGPKGRARQMNEGAARASGEFILFLHADTFLPRNALGAICSKMGNERYVGGAFELGYSSGRIFFRIVGVLASIRSRLTRVPYGDQAIFLRREYFETIGGYADIPLMEDAEMMRRIRRRGDEICILPFKVGSSPRRWETEGFFRCTLRNIFIAALYYLGVPPERLSRYYPPHNPEKDSRSP
ncbi:MAG: glycosyltransferase [Candidatus Latescibacteria bacterium]|nr:glycosyltransferase [Candidatus Latescibacterota bacterium]NIM21805.1 glycosyltransferase [Candidatus Latescibacterota bacterium]NIM65943.1 glycosyltransferase [Candidatus Latescibacterota bacterium]NIO02688.1 glycosyltransferase [Candidatus Latescibacterota bacterium]NIO29669.1 glycosyltransferase [Candidatus Latescibacterota bacterium]